MLVYYSQPWLTCVFFGGITLRSTVLSIILLISNLINEYNSLTLAPNMPCMLLVSSRTFETVYFCTCAPEVSTASVVKICTPCKYGHPGVPMHILVILGTPSWIQGPPFACENSWCVRHWRYGFSFKTCQVQVNGI